MKTLQFICLSLVIAVLSAGQAQAARFVKPCSGENATLECLKENFKDVYEDQYFKFLMIINKAEVEALNCDSSEKTAAYLDIASKIGKNREVEGGFKDFIETKFLKEKTTCFLDALLLNSDNVKDIILGNYLKKPSFISRSEVDSIFSQYMKQEKYKELLQRYSGK